MAKQDPSRPTHFYKIGALESALVALRSSMLSGTGANCAPLYLTPTQCAVLLEAARLGAAEIYQHPEILDRITWDLP